MTSQQILKDTREKMDKSLSHLVDQLRQIRTSRASPALVEGIRVDYYGTPSPISQVAQISVPEPRQLSQVKVPPPRTQRAPSPRASSRPPPRSRARRHLVFIIQLHPLASPSIAALVVAARSPFISAVPIVLGLGLRVIHAPDRRASRAP